MAWLQGWSNRIKVTIDSSKIDATLTQFPVMMKLSASCGKDSQDMTPVFDEVGANSLKIAVTSSDGTTELYVEVEYWDSGSEVAFLWISKAGWQISSSVDTIMYLYYDNNHVDNTTYIGVKNSVVAESIWKSTDKFVCHMQDGASNAAMYDSTGNDYDVTKKGANEPMQVVDADRGYTQSFDGNDYATFNGAIAAMQALATGHIVMWVRFDVINATQAVIAVTDSGDANSLSAPMYLHGGNNEIWAYCAETSDTTYYNEDFVSNPDSVADTWYRLVLNQDGTAPDLYVGKNKYNMGADTDPTKWIADVLNIDVVSIGYWITSGGADAFLQGDLSELRVSTAQVTQAEVDAGYESETDNLLSFTQESLTPAVWDFCTWA